MKKETELRSHVVARRTAKSIPTVIVGEVETVTTKQTIGDLLEELRTKHALTFQALGDAVGITRQGIQAIVSNKIKQPSPLTRRGLRQFLTSYDDPLARQLEDRLNTLDAAEEHDRMNKLDIDWLRTIHAASFVNGLRYLYAAENQSTIQFNKEADIQGTKYKSIENQVLPQLHTLNEIIAASCIDEQGLAAQRLRQKRSGIYPMTKDQLQHCSFGEFLTYVRNLKGLSFREATAPLDIKTYVLRQIEANQRILATDIDEKVIKFLELEADSALASIIRSKWDGKPPESLSDEILTQALSDKYLFATHIDTLPPYEMSKKEEELYLTLKNTTLPTSSTTYLGRSFRTIRIANHLTQIQFSDMLDVSQQSLSLLENGGIRHSDKTVVRICQQLGYDIHHPITHLMLDLALTDRRAKRAARSGDIFVAP